MDKETKEAYQEVYIILNSIKLECRSKIPKNLMKFIDENRQKEYLKEIDISKDLKDQNLKEKTISILAIIYYYYLTKDEKEKKELYETFCINDQKIEKEIKEKYDIEKLFDKRKEKNNVNIENTNEVALTKYKKENIFKSIINKLKKIFKIKD